MTLSLQNHEKRISDLEAQKPSEVRRELDRQMMLLQSIQEDVADIKNADPKKTARTVERMENTVQWVFRLAVGTVVVAIITGILTYLGLNA